MRWRKQGRVFVPSGRQWWARTHAHVPTVQCLGDGYLRVYYSGLDEQQFGRIGYLEVAEDDSGHVRAATDKPILDLGSPGTFDDCGVVPSCAVQVAGQTFLYYIGFQRSVRTPYQLFTGLAVGSADGRQWQRFAATPILDRTPDEPYARSAPCVLAENGRFRMWYWSGTGWERHASGLRYRSAFRHATSTDGIHWEVDPAVCLEPSPPHEYALGRPWVLRDVDHYRMWFSARAVDGSYTIGYAESADGLHWERLDERGGLRRSPGADWDSEMVCYPCVVDANGVRLMFYNGNRCGATGFGRAVLEEN